jgi:hypothetical protein
MNTIRFITVIVFILIAGIAFPGTASASGQVQAALGSIVPLSGYSYTGQTVYLFLTGPNLAPDGVALDNVNRPADNGGATQVDVDSNGHWIYSWNTGSSGGKLDTGIYTVWVADGPADLSHLSSVDFSTITVVLSEPTMTAGISTQPGQTQPQSSPPGFMNLTSTPTGASVVVNNAYRGATPLTITGLEAGTYNVTFTRFGYEKLSSPVAIESGSESDVNAILVPAVGSLAVNTSPAGSQLAVDGTYEGLSPATVANITQGGHTLMVTKAGFSTRNISFQVTAGQTSQVQVTLETAALPAAAVTRAAGLLPATILASGGAVLLVVFIRRKSRQ